MTEFSLYFPAGVVASSADDNVDVTVKLKDGRTFSLTFFTIANLITLMTRWGTTGECAGGLYVWAKNMIVVQEISEAAIRVAVHDLVIRGDIESAGWLIRGYSGSDSN